MESWIVEMSAKFECERNASPGATAEYAFDGDWLRALPDEALRQVWMSLTADNIKDSRVYIVRSEMRARGMSLPG